VVIICTCSGNGFHCKCILQAVAISSVSNKVSGTYRFGIRDRQQHSVKTPSNPYQGHSQFGYPREGLRDLLSRSTNGWVVGDHSTTVDRFETTANTKRNPQEVTEVTCCQGCLMLNLAGVSIQSLRITIVNSLINVCNTPNFVMCSGIQTGCYLTAQQS
jgi:hypothetical protein